jgi:hypothetical protein
MMHFQLVIVIIAAYWIEQAFPHDTVRCYGVMSAASEILDIRSYVLTSFLDIQHASQLQYNMDERPENRTLGYQGPL